MTAGWEKPLDWRLGDELFRLEPSELKLGYRLVGLDIDWQDSPFPGPALMLETFEQKRLLQQCCQWVIVDLGSSVNKARPTGRKVAPLVEQLPPLPKRIDLLQSSRLTPESMRIGLRIHRGLTDKVWSFLISFRRTGQLDMSLARSVVSLLVRAQKLSLAALVWLTRIKEARHYLAQHLVNTSILMAGFAQALNWNRERVETAALVGLLHDLGKVRLDLNLLTKPGQLSVSELEALRAHPEIGFELLKRDPELSWEVTGAVYASHERPDGLGYPRGLTGDAVPVLARMIGIVDAYDAMTSERAHGRPMTHQQALGVLWKQRGHQFDQTLVEAFAQFLGWVPPGTLLRLSDGRLAVALEMRRQGAIAPLVRPIIGPPQAFRLGEEIVLAARTDDPDPETPRIDELLPDNAHGYGMRELTAQLFDLLALPSHTTGDTQAASGAEAESLPRPVEEHRSPPPTEPDSVNREPTVQNTTLFSAQPGRHCLVVDHDPSIRSQLERFLVAVGFEVSHAESGAQALESMKNCPVDVIFFEILLSGMSGFALLRELRRSGLLENTAAVMVSGNPEAAEQYFLARIGADDFLPKPFGAGDVHACLDRLQRRGRLQPDASSLRPG